MLAWFASLSIGWLAALFAIAAAAVWAGGSRLAPLADALARRSGMGQAFVGMLLLGGITSLPEVAAVSTSAATGNASLAVNNLLGTAAINILLLASADFVFGRNALTAVAGRPSTLLQGVLAMLLSSPVALVAAAGDYPVLGVGAGTLAVAAGALLALRLAARFETREVWSLGRDAAPYDVEAERAADGADSMSTVRLALQILLCAALILGAGFVLSIAADAIARQTGIASGMIGFLLVGFATSLPEVSSIFSALRIGRPQLAIGDILGTNLFNVLLILLADIVYRGAPVLADVGRFEIIGAILPVLMTGLFLVGLLERRDRAVLRMGYDSLAAIIVFALGVWLLAAAM